MRKIFAFLFALVASAGAVFAESGTCGDNLKWDLTNGTLTISGKGAMTDYDKGKAPWYSYRTSIKRLTIESGATTIGNSAFYECSAITSVNIPDGVEDIGFYAFCGCTKLASVTLPNSLKFVGWYAFSDCPALTSVTVPNSVESVDEYAFAGVCNIVYHGSLEGAPWGARSLNGHVDGCLVYSDETKTTLLACSATATGELTLPRSLTTIGIGAFSSCTALTSIIIPNTVTSIGSSAFQKCTGLKSITLPDGLTTIEMHTFAYCSGLQSITIPNSVKIIDRYAFTGCSGLKNVTFPNGLTTIEESAFQDCSSLTSLNIPYSVTKIGNMTFYKCQSVKTITCEAAVPPTCSSGAFSWVTKTIPVYVPAESIDAYKEANIWKDFSDFQPIQAAEAEVTELKVELGEYSAVISWPAVEGAKEYTIQVSKGDKLICTLVFNESGQLVNIAFHMPSRNGANNSQVRAATQTATGWQYTIDGLEAGTEYDLTISAQNEEEQEIYKQNLSFQTEGGTQGIDDVQSDKVQSTKMLHNGMIYILRGEKVYTITGQIIK